MAKKSSTAKGLRLDFNAPVILCMTLISVLMLVALGIVGDPVKQVFGIYYTSFRDILMYPRLFTHILLHGDVSHLTGNYMLILAVGPMVEEKYGSRRLLLMIAVTAFITGLINVIFFKNVILMGASGVAFMLILLSSFVNIRERRIPLTVILVAVFFIGNEIAQGIFSADNISQISHIIGGLCGGVFGFIWRGI